MAVPTLTSERSNLTQGRSGKAINPFLSTLKVAVGGGSLYQKRESRFVALEVHVDSSLLSLPTLWTRLAYSMAGFLT